MLRGKKLIFKVEFYGFVSRESTMHEAKTKILSQFNVAAVDQVINTIEHKKKQPEDLGGEFLKHIHFFR